MDTLGQIAQCVEKSDIRNISPLIERAWEEGIPNDAILNDGLLKGINTLAENFENSRVFIADLLMASKVYGRGAELIYASEQVEAPRKRGTVMLATPAGDIHDIGKNIIAAVVENAGFEVIDLGVDVRPGEIVDAVAAHGPDIIGLSATLTSTLFIMKEAVELLEELGMRDEVKVVIGGAATKIEGVNELIGSDAHSRNATDVVSVLESVLER